LGVALEEFRELVEYEQERLGFGKGGQHLKRVIPVVEWSAEKVTTPRRCHRVHRRTQCVKLVSHRPVARNVHNGALSGHPVA
jgi:hypothetical protein